MPSEPRVEAIAHVIQLAVAPVFLLMAHPVDDGEGRDRSDGGRPLPS